VSGGGAFQGRAALWLGLAAAGSLAVSGLLAVFGDEFGPPPSPGADGFSRSALGHAAFLELLRSRGVRVTTSRHRTQDRTGDAVVAFLEPRIRARPPKPAEAKAGEQKPAEQKGAEQKDGEPKDAGDEAPPDPNAAVLQEAAESAERLLVVLPKRLALIPETSKPGWLARTMLGNVEAAQAVLDAAGVEGEVFRPTTSIELRGELPSPTLDGPQLVRDSGLVPLVGTADAMLVGELVEDGLHLIVLADPDVLATHGLGKGANAELAVAIVERLGAAEHGLVVDETTHGFELTPSLARELFRPPLVLATAQALLTLALLAWISLVRFGRPHPPHAVLGAGAAVLVDHTARLLSTAGHVGHAAGAYWRATRDEIARRLRPPGGVEPFTWLERTAEARGLGDALRTLHRRAAALAGRGPEAEQETVRLAQDIHTFREELTHGRDPHDGR